MHKEICLMRVNLFLVATPYGRDPIRSKELSTFFLGAMLFSSSNVIV